MQPQNSFVACGEHCATDGFGRGQMPGVRSRCGLPDTRRQREMFVLALVRTTGSVTEGEFRVGGASALQEQPPEGNQGLRGRQQCLPAEKRRSHVPQKTLRSRVTTAAHELGCARAARDVPQHVVWKRRG